MNPAAWITLAIGASGLMLNVIAIAVGYGVLRGTVVAIDGRVKALEAEVAAITDLKVAVGVVAAKQDALLEQLRDLAASVRWMRDPAATGAGSRRRRGAAE